MSNKQFAAVLTPLADMHAGDLDETVGHMVKLTQDDARAILEQHGVEHQRAADAGHIASIADLMNGGEWVGASSLIFCVDAEGSLRLVDGQHRLRAYYDHKRMVNGEGVDLPFYLQCAPARWTPAEAYAHLDTVQKVRNGGVIAQALGVGIRNPTLLKGCLGIAEAALKYSSVPLSTFTAVLTRQEEGRDETMPARRVVPIREKRIYVNERVKQFNELGDDLYGAMGQGAKKPYARFLLGARVAPIVIEALKAERDEAMSFFGEFIKGNASEWPIAGAARDYIRDHTDRLRYTGRPQHRPWALALAWLERKELTDDQYERRVRRNRDHRVIGVCDGREMIVKHVAALKG